MDLPSNNYMNVSDVESDLEEVLSDFRACLGQDRPLGKLGQVYNSVRELNCYQQSDGSLETLRSKLLEDTTQYALVCAFTHAARILYTHRNLPNCLKDNKYYEKLAKGNFLIAPNETSNAEADSKPANVFIQYYFAALYAHAGYTIKSFEKPHDISANDNNTHFDAECKRITSLNNLKRNAKKARKQLSISENTRLALLDVSNLIYAPCLIARNWKSSEINEYLKDNLKQL